MTKYYTVAELAAEWKLSERTIRTYVAKRKINVTRIFGTIRIPVEEVRRLEVRVAARRCEADRMKANESWTCEELVVVGTLRS